MFFFICCVLSGGSIKCYECSNKSECDAIVDQSEPKECSEMYVPESREVRPEFDRCLRITDVGPIPIYKRVCGNERISSEYKHNCVLPDCTVLACYSDKCLI